MRAVLRMELIGDDTYQYERAIRRGAAPPPTLRQEIRMFQLNRPGSRPWVARITGLCPQYGFKREFMRGQKDYTLANGTGSRGIYVYYPLTPGLYEVNERLTWKRTRRYFIRVEGTDITEISREEVETCLKSMA